MRMFMGAALIAVTMGCSQVSAQGYQVQPMLATIEPSGANARLTMSIKNTGAVPITLEMIPFRATVDEAGTPTRVDEEKDVMVYPAQTAIEPGKEQTVQVRYIGDPALAMARMYGVRVSQLPLNIANGTTTSSGAATDVKVSFNFLSHIVVSPPAAKPALTLQEAGRAPNGDLMLRIDNGGKGVSMMNAAKLTLTDAAGRSVTLDADHVNIGNFSAFMPGQVRRATIASKDVAGLSGSIKPTLSDQ